MEPGLLAITGRTDHQALEAAIDAVHEGQWPGWQITYDEIVLEMLPQGRQRTTLIDMVVGIEDPQGILTRTNTHMPQRIWVLVLEQPTTRRREVIKFLLDGGDEENPDWVRIRPDASVPIPAP